MRTRPTMTCKTSGPSDFLSLVKARGGWRGPRRPGGRSSRCPGSWRPNGRDTDTRRSVLWAALPCQHDGDQDAQQQETKYVMRRDEGRFERGLDSERGHDFHTARRECQQERRRRKAEELRGQTGPERRHGTGHERRGHAGDEGAQKPASVETAKPRPDKAAHHDESDGRRPGRKRAGSEVRAVTDGGSRHSAEQKRRRHAQPHEDEPERKREGEDNGGRTC